jgi:hypothetical protein
MLARIWPETKIPYRKNSVITATIYTKLSPKKNTDNFLEGLKFKLGQ